MRTPTPARVWEVEDEGARVTPGGMSWDEIRAGSKKFNETKASGAELTG